MPTIVQGEYAIADIVKSLQILDSMPDVDVIIVGRGGGSVEDLWAFNAEEVARAVVACKTPVVSAVGHETDFTICDFVSDLRAPTPSAAAELVCPDICSLINYTNSLDEALYQKINDKIDNEFQRVNELTEESVLSDFSSVIEKFEDNLQTISERMAEAIDYSIERKELYFASLVGKLNALSPLAVLSRGYAVVQKDEKIIKSVSKLKKDDNITLRLSGGTALCSVTEVEANE